MAAADFCKKTLQTSPDKARYLSPNPCPVYMKLLESVLGFTV